MSKSGLHYRQLGESGSSVIALHGLLGSLENLGAVTRQLSTDYQVYAIDLPNHGNSPHSDYMTLASMAKTVVQWMNVMGIDNAHLLGHSLGGKVSMEMSLLFPHKVNSLIVADIAPVRYLPRHQQIFTALRAVDLAAIGSRREADQQMKVYLTDQATRRFLLKNLVKEKDCWRWRMNLTGIEANYPQLLAENCSDRPPYQKPVLFIKGGNSDYLLPAYRQSILTRFPKATVKQIEDTGHWLHAEKPEVFTRTVKRFLAAV